MTVHVFAAGEHDDHICAHILSGKTVSGPVEHDHHEDGSVTVDFPGLTAQQITDGIASYDPAAVPVKPDPDEELSAAIAGVSTSGIADAATKKAIEGLQAALLGNKSQAKVKGRPV